MIVDARAISSPATQSKPVDTLIEVAPALAVSKSLVFLSLCIPKILTSPVTASTLPPASIHVE